MNALLLQKHSRRVLSPCRSSTPRHRRQWTQKKRQLPPLVLLPAPAASFFLVPCCCQASSTSVRHGARGGRMEGRLQDEEKKSTAAELPSVVIVQSSSSTPQAAPSPAANEPPCGLHPKFPVPLDVPLQGSLRHGRAHGTHRELKVLHQQAPDLRWAGAAQTHSRSAPSYLFGGASLRRSGLARSRSLLLHRRTAQQLARLCRRDLLQALRAHLSQGLQCGLLAAGAGESREKRRASARTPRHRARPRGGGTSISHSSELCTHQSCVMSEQLKPSVCLARLSRSPCGTAGGRARRQSRRHPPQRKGHAGG